MKNKYLKFWGTRGSCPVSGPEYLQFGGNTPCLEFCYEDIRIVFDAGTGIRSLGKILLKEKVKKIDLFLSHTHWDHITGFPFFEPIYQSDVSVTIWAPYGQGRTCHTLFKELLAPEFFPLRLSELQAELHFKRIIEEKQVKKGPVTISFHKVNHPGLTYCFKIETPHQTIGYVTDNELSEGNSEEIDSLVAFYKGCDLLIHEAQYFPEEYVQKKGWGHSCILTAGDFIQKTGAKKWLISHHDPVHTDEDIHRIAAIARERCSVPSECVRDGQVIDLL